MYRHWVLFFGLVCIGLLNAEWSPVTVLSPQGDYRASDTPPIDVASNSRGDVVAVFLQGLIDGNWVIQASSKPFNGYWQPTPDILSTPGSSLPKDAPAPKVAIDENGNATAVWKWNVGGDWIIQSSTKPYGGSWQTNPDSLSQSGLSADVPQITVDAQGNVTAVWSELGLTNSFIQASTKPYGDTWQLLPDDISITGQDATSPQVATDSHGNVTAVWSRYNGSNWIVQSSTKPYGGSWPVTPDDVSPSGQDSQDPQVAIDPQGNATVVWVDVASETILASSKSYGGAWQVIPDNVSQVGTSDSPQVAVDASGNVSSVWRQWDGSGWVIQASTKLFGGAWQTPDTLSSSNEIGDVPQIVVDGFGNATVVWLSTLFKVANVVDASAKPFGGTWQAVPNQISLPGPFSRMPVISVDGRGSVTAAWMSVVNHDLLSTVQTSTNTLVPLPPASFTGIKAKKRNDLFLNTRWEESETGGIVRYEIFARNKLMKQISSNKKTKIRIRLRPRHHVKYLSKKYRCYLHDKYKIRAIGTNGVASPFIRLNVEH